MHGAAQLALWNKIKNRRITICIQTIYRKRRFLQSIKKVFTIHEYRIERDKEYIAFLKHLATLNTGSIGLIAVFAKDFKAAVQSNTMFLTFAV